jgi:hypothetical protein
MVVLVKRETVTRLGCLVKCQTCPEYRQLLKRIGRNFVEAGKQVQVHLVTQNFTSSHSVFNLSSSPSTLLINLTFFDHFVAKL